MANKVVIVFTVCTIVLSSLIWSAIGVKLNERRILLPFNTGVNTNFTLEATNDNCYQWSSSRLDIASVEALAESSQGCSKGAVVSVVSTSAKRQSSVVTATDSASGSVIRCDVEVDVINSIEIITTSHDIVLEDLPEILEVKAKNDKNDTFTSIAGIQFEWTLSPVDILRYRTWSSSSYVGPPFVHYWESRDAKGSAILIEGVRTGSAKVSARIVGDEYKKVKPAEITLHVIANLALIPQNIVYLLKGSKIEFKAEMTKQGPRVPLTLPSPQYYLKVLDPKIALLDDQTSQVEAIKDGQTSLLLLDRNVATSESSRQPTTEIHVMPPSYLTIHVTPGDNFALCEFTSYVVTYTIHDDWHHRLYPAANLQLKVTFPSRYFHINDSTTNGTHHTIRTINSGNTKISAQLIGAGNVKLTAPLEHSQEVTIYRTLLLTPNLIILPWIPKSKPTYTVFVTATGATGQYRWVSNNSLVATVAYKTDQSAKVKITTKDEGEALISCQDVHNSVFSANMRTVITPVVEIEILPVVLETHVGGTVILPIAVSGYENEATKQLRVFDDCSQIPFEVEIIEKTRVKYDANNIVAGIGKRSCRSLAFDCISTGNTRVWIRYGKELSSTAIIGCHLPLKAVHPTEYAVMSLGASIDVAFEGGPRPWTLHPDGHYTRLSSTESSVVSSTEIADRYRYNKDLHVFRIKCLQYGETSLEIEVGNLASSTLPNPASAKASVNIFCSRPTSMIIKPKMKSSCPLSPPQDSVFPVEKGQNIEIEVDVRDDAGRSFYNISTLDIVWNMDGIDGLEVNNGVKEIINGAKGYFSITRNVQILKQFRTNSHKLSAEIVGYKKQFNDRFRIFSEIELIAVDKASVERDSINIYNHPKQKFVVNIQKGSGYFDVDAETEKQLITINFKQQSKTFNIVPKTVGRGVIKIIDLCLANYENTDLEYAVVEASDINVEIVDKFQLGSVVEGYVTVIDNNDNYIDSANHKFIDLVPNFSNNVLTLSNLSVSDDIKSSFKLNGEKLGISSLKFISQSAHTNYIESTPISIQVFAPLRITPSNLTLIVGAHFQVTTFGGPQPQRNIEYSLADNSVAKVGPNGLLNALKLGKTKLIIRILSADNIEYTRSEVDLYVVALNKIKIVSQTNQLKTGSKLSLQLMGANEFETPFTFGATNPSLKITWSLSNDNIAAIEDIFQTSGIVNNNMNSISMRLRGISSGIVSVIVRVETQNAVKDREHQQIENNVILTDSIQIHIFPSFSIVSNDRNIDERVVLMSPNSQISLQSNRIGEAESQFQLLNATNVKLSCGLETCLKAGPTPEVSALIVRTNEKIGVTLTSVFSIRVDKISYFMVNSLYKISEEPINVFPIGSELQTRISYHDNIGKPFDAVRSQIRWTLSRNDLMSISRGSDNTTLKIRSLKEGRTLVKVYDSENNNINEYFNVDVGPVIEPQDLQLSIGEVVCPYCKLKDTKAGVWSVENQLIADIDEQSGVIVAKSVGHTLLYWTSNNKVSTFTTINVKMPKKISLDTTRLVGITNIVSHLLPINIESESRNVGQRRCISSVDSLNLQTLESPFICEIVFDNNYQQKSIWKTGVQFDVNSDKWLCSLEPKADINYSEMSSIETNVTVSVIMLTQSHDSSVDYKPLIHTISVPFLPAFDISPKQVILTPEQPEARLTVYSASQVLQDLTIVTSNPDVIDVSTLEIIGNTLKISIFLTNADIFSNDVSNLHLSFNSRLTQQKLKIPVQIKLFRHNIQSVSSMYLFLKEKFIYLLLFTIIIGAVVYKAIKFFQSKVSPIATTTLPMNPGSPFLADIHSPLKGQRVLDYTLSPTQTPHSTSTPRSPRVGRPLYSVTNT